jgi:hypothetical protein
MSTPASNRPALAPVTAGHWLARALAQPWVFSLWCMLAAFGAYACMYGFRKPFTSATYLDPPFQEGFKTWLVLAQVLGYTLSKFIGIKVIAEMTAARRLRMLLLLVGLAEVALLLFGAVPPPFNAAWLFLNGLALGMVFGLVLGFLEGRRMTEAFVAGLCASFIFADGFTKSVGAWLLQAGVSERWMPGCAGGLFLLPLLGFVWMLRQIPPPDAADVAARAERVPMAPATRRTMRRRYAVGLAGITITYLLITVLRSMRADFAPEIWAALGTRIDSAVYTRSEIWVAVGVLSVNGLLVLVRDNRCAFFLALGIAMAGLGLIGVSLVGLGAGLLAPFPFMVLIGLGLYVPYVLVHTTVFERLIAVTRDRGNIGYLLYLADAFGYLGYVVVMVAKNFFQPAGNLLGLFTLLAWVVAGGGLLALLGAAVFFARSRHFLGATAAVAPDEAAPLSQGPPLPVLAVRNSPDNTI